MNHRNGFVVRHCERCGRCIGHWALFRGFKRGAYVSSCISAALALIAIFLTLVCDKSHCIIFPEQHWALPAADGLRNFCQEVYLFWFGFSYLLFEPFRAILPHGLSHNAFAFEIWHSKRDYFIQLLQQLGRGRCRQHHLRAHHLAHNHALQYRNVCLDQR